MSSVGLEECCDVFGSSMSLDRSITENKTPKIRVLVRKRPLNQKESGRGETDIVTIENGQTVIIKENKLKVDLTPYIEENKYNFDGAYDQFATNEHIYQTAISPLIDCAFDGAKVTCFAYGQTGSGKTHTMLGNGTTVKGLYLLAAEEIFKKVKNRPDLTVWLSFYEIYCGKLFDLFNNKNELFAREDHNNKINIAGLSESQVCSCNDLMEYLSYGTSARVTSQNSTNNDSSRSHAILQITLKSQPKSKGKVHGKITFIDLAGSERAADHADQYQKQTRIDGAQINKSLLALKECIRALDQNKHHTPFRGSKLTMVLKDSFTGYCRTVMIGNISPNSSSSEDTLNTLKYADRVKELKKTREQPFDLNKIDQLERQLMLPRNGLQLRPRAQTKPEIDERQNTKALGNKINTNQNRPKVIPIVPKQRMSPRPQQSPPPPHPQHPSHRRNSQIQSVLNSVSSATSAVTANINALASKPRMANNYVQISSPPRHATTPISIDQLSEKHDQYIELILQQQQKLIKHHQLFINQTIQMTKEDMRLRNEADKIGSNIEDYLDSLEELLERRAHSIMQLRDKVKNIKGYLYESKKIEEQYSKLEKVLVQQEEGLLDEDQELFV